MARHLVLIGGGHSHVQVLESLADEPIPGFQVTVVVDSPIAIYSGMVPGFVAGQYGLADLEIDIQALAERAGAQVVVARALKIDPENRQIVVADHPDLVRSRFGQHRLHGSRSGPAWRSGIRSSDPAHRRTGAPHGRLDQRASGRHEPFHLSGRRRRRRGGRGRIGFHPPGQALCGERPAGGGSTGPFWGALDGRIPSGIGAAGSTVTQWHEAFPIQPNRRVVGADAGTVRFETGDPLPFDALVWVVGAASHPLFRDSGLPIDPRGSARIGSTLQVEGESSLFAVGDCAHLIDFPQTPKAGVYAVRQGPVLTDNLRAKAAGRTLENYRPQTDFLTLLNLGDGSALGAKWGRSFEGRWVTPWLEDRIDRAFMKRFQASQH